MATYLNKYFRAWPTRRLFLLFSVGHITRYKTAGGCDAGLWRSRRRPATTRITNVDDATLLQPILYLTQYVLYYKTEIKCPTVSKLFESRGSPSHLLCATASKCLLVYGFFYLFWTDLKEDWRAIYGNALMGIQDCDFIYRCLVTDIVECWIEWFRCRLEISQKD